MCHGNVQISCFAPGSDLDCQQRVFVSPARTGTQIISPARAKCGGVGWIDRRAEIDLVRGRAKAVSADSNDD